MCVGFFCAQVCKSACDTEWTWSGLRFSRWHCRHSHFMQSTCHITDVLSYLIRTKLSCIWSLQPIHFRCDEYSCVCLVVKEVFVPYRVWCLWSVIKFLWPYQTSLSHTRSRKLRLRTKWRHSNGCLPMPRYYIQLYRAIFIDLGILHLDHS